MRRWRWPVLVVGLLLLAVVAAVCSIPRFRKQVWPPVLTIPPAEEVAEMRASLRATPGWYIPEVPEFVVPQEHVPKILHWVRPTRYDSEAAMSPRQLEWGQLRIRDVRGREVSVRFYEMGMNPTVFTSDGIDYFWGGWYGKTEDGKQAMFIAALALVEEIRKASPSYKP